MNSLLMRRKDLLPSSLMLSRSWRQAARISVSRKGNRILARNSGREACVQYRMMSTTLPSIRCFSTVENSSTEEEQDENTNSIVKNIQSPVHALNLFYGNQHKLPSINACFHAEEVDLHLWTAKFICPITGDSFPAGVQRGVENAGRDNLGRVVYRKKVLACHAASARALDIFQYRNSGIAEPRLCEEDPAVEILQDVDPLSDTTEEESEVLDSHTQESSTFLGMDVEAIEQREASDTEEAEEWSLTEISENKSDEEDAAQDDQLNVVLLDEVDKAPFQLLLEKLTSSVSTKDASSPNLGSTVHPTQRRRAAIAAAEAWLAACEFSWARLENAHHVVLSEEIPPNNNIKLGKSILRNLALALQVTPLGTKEAQGRVEHMATKVMTMLHKSEGFKPDAETYTYYIKCIDGSSPLAKARKAQRFVEAMENGQTWKGHMLPKPDIGTINALIQLFAQVGGREGRYAHVNSSFQPNKESFLCILSSLAYLPSAATATHGFDPNFALQCIKRMEELNKTLGNDSQLSIDTQVYNAPLRWSGGGHWYAARPYARYLTWDKFSRIYTQGFRDFDSSDFWWGEACKIDEWRRMMEEFDDPARAPNLETEEAVIQAWVRTRTREGLEKAWNLALQIIEKYSNGEGTLRLQTFLPIFAAWLHSKSPEAPTKIKEMMETLSRHAKTDPAIAPDGRVREAYIASIVSRQEYLMKHQQRHRDVQQDKLQDNLYSSALECSEALDSLWQSEQDHVNRKGIILDASSFAFTIRAWYNVAAESNSASVSSIAMQEMFKTLELFEGVVAGQFVGWTKDKRPIFSGQGLNLIHKSYQILDSFLECMMSLDQKNEGKLTESERVINANLVAAWIEKFLRRAAEFRELELVSKENSEDSAPAKEKDTMNGGKTSATLRYLATSEDLFTFSLDEVRLFSARKSAVMWKVGKYVAGCERRSPGNRGMIRSLLLIRDMAKTDEPAVAQLVDRNLRQILGQLDKPQKPAGLSRADVLEKAARTVHKHQLLPKSHGHAYIRRKPGRSIRANASSP